MKDKTNKKASKSTDKALEKEIVSFINRAYEVRNDETLINGDDYLTTHDLSNIAKHFANWQKEQLMKEAIDGEIIDLCDHEIAVKEFLDLLINIPKRFKAGDKVKVIIIKKD